MEQDRNKISTLWSTSTNIVHIERILISGIIRVTKKNTNPTNLIVIACHQKKVYQKKINLRGLVLKLNSSNTVSIPITVKKESGSINHANDPLTQCSSTVLVYYFCFSISTSLQSFCSKNTLYEYKLINNSVNPSHGYPFRLLFKKLAF